MASHGSHRQAFACVGIALGLTFAAWHLYASNVHKESINRSEYLPVNGRKLYLLLRGADRKLPIILWLHGGPGGTERPLFRYYNHELEKDFAVAYWDQRGTGRSFDPKEDPDDLTIARHLADLDAVIDHLKRTLPSDRIFLVGHSWGAALGILYAGAHPHRVAAAVAVNPVVSTSEQRRAEYQFVLQEAAERHDDRTLHAAENMGPPPYTAAKQVLSLERLAGKYGGVFHHRPARVWIMFRGLLGGLVWPWEIPRYIHANNVSLQAMNDELRKLDLVRSTPALDVPVLFFLGRYDRHADARVSSAYFEKLHAPAKRLLWFENSAHNIPFEEPGRFNAALSRELRSLIASGG